NRPQATCDNHGSACGTAHAGAGDAQDDPLHDCVTDWADVMAQPTSCIYCPSVRGSGSMLTRTICCSRASTATVWLTGWKPFFVTRKVCDPADRSNDG